MAKAGKGRAGCGCVIFVLVVCMVLAGLLVHPFSLRLMAGRFRHEDRVVPCDAIFVPRFVEDRNGEVYAEAFREYWAGDGKVIWVEDDRVLGLSLKDIVVRMAKERGIKEAAVHGLTLQGDDAAKAREALAALARQRVKKIVLIVPGYASKRYQLLYGAANPDDSMLVLVKPVSVSYFKADKWWSDGLSRSVMEREFYGVGLYYARWFKHNEKGDSGKNEDGPQGRP
jgi:hypothetical protein